MASEIQLVLITALLLSATSFCKLANVFATPLDTSKIHEYMTDDEFFSVFNTKDRTEVPDYEVVPLHHRKIESHRSRRSPQYNKRGHISVTLKNLELYLEPVDHVLIGEDTPVYTAYADKSQALGIRYKRVHDVWPSTYSMYQDVANNAALVMYEEPDGQINFQGTIGDDLVVKPVPSRLKNAECLDHILHRRERWRIRHPHFGLSPPPTTPFQHLTTTQEPLAHPVVNIIPRDYVRLENTTTTTTQRPRQTVFLPTTTQKPQSFRPEETQEDTVYPEVLVIVDYATYLAHGKNLQALTKYMAVFWNAVDLRFRAIRNPRVRLNIAGLIVPTDEYGAFYMTLHRQGQHFLRSTETFDQIGKYLHQDKRFSRSMYDIAVAITSFNLCKVGVNGCDPATLGLSRVGGACKPDEESAAVSLALVEDRGGFDGVLVAAHEIGHLLGAVHDGENSNSGPGAENCDVRDGFLMGYSADGWTRAFGWSNCSIEQIQYFLGREAECLRNKPEMKNPYPKMLPGQLMSRDEQCRILHGMVECKNYSKSECGALYCRKPGSLLHQDCISSRPPAEGLPCSNGGTCLAGFCAHEKVENSELIETASSTKRPELIAGAD